MISVKIWYKSNFFMNFANFSCLIFWAQNVLILINCILLGYLPLLIVMSSHEKLISSQKQRYNKFKASLNFGLDSRACNVFQKNISVVF